MLFLLQKYSTKCRFWLASVRQTCLLYTDFVSYSPRQRSAEKKIWLLNRQYKMLHYRNQILHVANLKNTKNNIVVRPKQTLLLWVFSIWLSEPFWTTISKGNEAFWFLISAGYKKICVGHVWGEEAPNSPPDFFKRNGDFQGGLIGLMGKPFNFTWHHELDVGSVKCFLDPRILFVFAIRSVVKRKLVNWETNQ